MTEDAGLVERVARALKTNLAESDQHGPVDMGSGDKLVCYVDGDDVDFRELASAAIREALAALAAPSKAMLSACRDAGLPAFFPSDRQWAAILAAFAREHGLALPAPAPQAPAEPAAGSQEFPP